MLKVNGLSVQLNGKQVLQNICFELAPASRTVLLGENGAGKSTLLRALAGMQQKSTGEISMAGRITVLGQSVGFPKGLKVKEVVGLVHNLAKQPRDLNWIKQTCNLDDFFDQKVDALSGGQHRRLAIALSLIETCDLLLLDEPSNALDYQSKQNLLAGLGTLECAIVLCTHNLDEAQQLAEQLLVLEQGELVFHGTKQTMLTRLKRYAINAKTKVTQISNRDLGPANHNGQLAYYTNTPEQDARELLNQDSALSALRVREISLNEAIQQFKSQRSTQRTTQGAAV